MQADSANAVKSVVQEYKVIAMKDVDFMHVLHINISEYTNIAWTYRLVTDIFILLDVKNLYWFGC